MRRLRNHLRLWAVVALACHAAWIPALVPQDCCERHCAATIHDDDCLDVMSALGCGMDHGPEGMFSSNHPQDRDACALTAACAGPLAALGALLSQNAVTVERVAPVPATSPRSAPDVPAEPTLDHRTPPDLPPPRV
jgi:hypothetical protein